MVPARRLRFADIKHHGSFRKERRGRREKLGTVLPAAGIVPSQVETDAVAPCGNLPPVLHERHASLFVRHRGCDQGVSIGAVALEADPQPARRPSLARIQHMRRDAPGAHLPAARTRAGNMARHIGETRRWSGRCGRARPRWSRGRVSQPRPSAPKHVPQPLLCYLLLFLGSVIELNMHRIVISDGASERGVSNRRVPKPSLGTMSTELRAELSALVSACLEIKPERQPWPGPHFHSENSFP